MAWPVYSTTFIAANVTPAAAAIYTVPAGRVAIVSSTDFVLNDKTHPGLTSAAIDLTGAGSYVLFYSVWFTAITASAADSRHWAGHIAVPAGGHIAASVVGTGCITGVTIAGYLISVA